jgi:hypothetical protein
MRFDWSVIVLGVCLIASVTATVVVAVAEGGPAIAGTGLGALTAGLGGALAWRVKTMNGKK